VLGFGVAAGIGILFSAGSGMEEHQEKLQGEGDRRTLITNKGNDIDITPRENHTSTTQNPATHPEWPHEHFWDWSTGSPIRR